MKKTLSRYGNSFALIIDKPILELLNISDSTILHISTDGTQLIIRPEVRHGDKSQTISQDKTMQKIIEDALDEYADALHKLAKK